MTDNQPSDLLGCYGNTEIKSPNLDKMAKEGVVFENAFCPNAMCSPSRASVWTGLMPSQHGIHTWLDDRLMAKWPKDWNALKEFDTLPEILKRNGYDTAMIGKYHLGCLEKPQNSIDHWITMGRGHTLDFYGNTIIENSKKYIHEGHSVELFTSKAVEYVKGRTQNRESPFLLLLPYNGPYGHWPSIKGPAKNQFGSYYEKLNMNSVPREGLCKEAIECFQMNSTYHSKSKGGPDFSALLQIPNDLSSLRNYYSQMSLIDHGIGELFKALKASSLDRNTLVIFTADHGFSLGHHGFWGHGQATWPTNAFRIAYNIPLLVWGSDPVKSGIRCENFVSSLDIFSTILDILKIENPDTDGTNPSKSLKKLLAGNNKDWVDEIFIENEETRAIRTPNWSYVKRFNGSKAYPLNSALYDLKNDPDERINIYSDSSPLNIQNELDKRLCDFFNKYVEPEYDLWKGGTVKSNTSRPWLWEDAWGPEWHPIT